MYCFFQSRQTPKHLRGQGCHQGTAFACVDALPTEARGSLGQENNTQEDSPGPIKSVRAVAWSFYHHHSSPANAGAFYGTQRRFRTKSHEFTGPDRPWITPGRGRVFAMGVLHEFFFSPASSMADFC
jgi:hypothetical protein